MDNRLLTRTEARRITVRAQLLDAPRPRDLATVLERLTFLQLDPTAAIAPSADLVAWSRMGDAYQPSHLQEALEVERSIFEHSWAGMPNEPTVAMVRPMSHLGLYLADRATWAQRRPAAAEWVAANDAFRRDLLSVLRTSGPLTSREIPDTAVLPWASTGWTNDRNVTQMLSFLTSLGEVAVAGRRGRQRVWDVADRVYPPDVHVVPAGEAERLRNEQRLRWLGVARPKFVGDAGAPAEIEGTAGEWRVDPDATAARFKGRTALLSPFDRLIHDRVRAAELFDFEYTLEMYKAAAQRRWGYFALPVLHGDRLVGKLDAKADRKAGRLEVFALHQDVPFTPAITKAVDAEIRALATWLDLDVVDASDGSARNG